MFGSNLFDPAALASAVASGPGGPLGLSIVETKLSEVIATLEEQKTAIADLDFAGKAHIGKGSFGSGIEASALALDHAKAHAVIVDTLDAMILDLDRFQSAVVAARGDFGQADADAQEQLQVVLTSLNDLDLGGQALRDAQVRHSADVATEEPVPAAGEGN